MRKYILNEAAVDDLDDIYHYIAKTNRTAAAKLIRELYAEFDRIVENPDIGRERDKFSEGLRGLVSGNYLIFYRVVYDEIRVSRVVHGARDLTKIIFE